MEQQEKVANVDIKTATSKSETSFHEVVALDAAKRVVPIHPVIPEVKLSWEYSIRPASGTVSSSDANAEVGEKSITTTLNPVTLRPFTLDELRSHNLESLIAQYTNQDAAAKARDDVAKELRKILDENEKKTKEIDRDLEEKEKTREIERKVYARKLGRDG